MTRRHCSVRARAALTAAGVAAAALVALPGLAAAPAVAASPATRPFPDVLPLPADYLPEGIAGGTRTTFYAGSRPGPAGGGVYRGDLRTGTGAVLVEPTPGGASIGMTYDTGTGLLWVAGGPTGTVTAYDGDTGDVVARYTAPASTTGRFLNDVDLSGTQVFVTDSLNAELVVLPRRPVDGGASGPTLLPLSGDWSQSPTGFDANGIRTLPGGDLLVVDQGELLRVDRTSGVADRLEQTAGEDLTAGDGLELRGTTLYVVFGFGEDSVAVVDLDLAGGTYAVTGELRQDEPVEDDLERPTTALFKAGSLWVVNGKFSSGPTTDQEVVRVDLP
ncbi:hypothetical protein [Jannaschia sp. R86511]|uniref:hypothetical protein n=1 Tax=Jannaschia sp. R86511 TaxID=3093853 RepID=UPI0036D2EB52